jgi:hypothetical protein
MSQIIEVKVPDIGNFHDVPIIDLCVAAGASVNAEDPLLTLESDKATIDIPAPPPVSSRNSRSRSATRYRKAHSSHGSK